MIPVLNLELFQGGADLHTGVIDQDVDGPGLLLDAIYGRRDFFLIGYVEDTCEDFHAVGAKLSRLFGNGIAITAVYDQAGAGGSQPGSEDGSQAPARAGNQGQASG